MNVTQLKHRLMESDRITAWRELAAKEASYEDFPDNLELKLINVLKDKNIKQLYTHQARALTGVAQGKNIAIVTPTASGKTLCYNLPVLNSILKKNNTRALYLFPTKALSQDQLAGLYSLITALDEDIKTYTYDGDTDVNARKSIRQAGHIVITNPDMLHTGILPHHTKWIKLFENLEYVILDEIHSYRGVFGSHVANVLRRLRRICQFYGSSPRYICSSATIANPCQLSKKLIGDEVEVITENGAPRGPKDFAFYNPPVVNRELGIRRSYILESKSLAATFLKNNIKTIIFARSRLNTEILLSYLKSISRENREIRGYRGGYLPGERRNIEQGLREGRITGVVSTNALELGIDIGTLDACIMAGYPGTIASTWQQAGRAGRGEKRSIAVLVASSSPLDQYIVNHPDYFFEQSAENALINPNNLLILMSHIKCAAFELPFVDGEKFGVDTTGEILAYLEEEGILRHKGGRWHWMDDRYPAADISLRSASSEDFAVIDITSKSQVIGRVDYFSAPTTIHEKAIYLHESRQYQVEELDFEERKAYVKQVDVNYYTDANLAVDLRVLEQFDETRSGDVLVAHGEVVVSAKATMFKKVKFHTHENVGYGDINLPEVEMHTTSYWFTLPQELKGRFGSDGLENALVGLSRLLVNIAPIYLMCEPGDIHTVTQIKSPFTTRPTIFIYDSYPGGVGMSEKLFDIHQQLLERAREHLWDCECESGCPSCVGAAAEVGLAGKEYTDQILDYMLQQCTL